MPNAKKTPKEKALTRHLQNQRAAKRKEQQGLKRVSLWVPAEALDQVQNLTRIGIIVAADGASTDPIVAVLQPDGSFKFPAYRKTLLS